MTRRPPATTDRTAPGRAHDRPVAPGGRLRLVLGFLIGALVGALLALVLPRDDGPRRAARSMFPADPLGPGPPHDPAPPPR